RRSFKRLPRFQDDVLGRYKEVATVLNCNFKTVATFMPLSYISTDGGVNWALSKAQPPLDTSGGGQRLGVG
ncbi:MAG: hypothetical protein WCR08_06030, partial [Gammaproteobacteria bacterium]